MKYSLILPLKDKEGSSHDMELYFSSQLNIIIPIFKKCLCSQFLVETKRNKTRMSLSIDHKIVSYHLLFMEP